jgi:glycosyltransferase involved in cell wall biosynthesis
VSAPEPQVSVVICTRNRAGLLQQAIASVVEQEVHRADLEVIVVDNGSSDGTLDVARSFGPPVRYLREDRIGLCIARNTGWRAAIGRYIAFFDDDAIAAPGWLEAICEAFATGPPDLAIVGGRVEPVWQGPPPTWLSRDVAGSLAIVDWGPAADFIGDIRRRWLAGVNMAVRRSVLEEIGGFHPWLDRVGGKLLSSGDVFLQKQALERGYRCLYLPEMTVRHLVPTARLTQGWFRRRFLWQGISDAVMLLIERGPTRGERLRLAIRRAAKMLRSPGKLAALIRPTVRPNTFRTKCHALIDVGYILGLLGAAGH